MRLVEGDRSDFAQARRQEAAPQVRYFGGFFEEVKVKVRVRVKGTGKGNEGVRK
jgi:hypothetical protein